MEIQKTKKSNLKKEKQVEGHNFKTYNQVLKTKTVGYYKNKHIS